MADGEDAPVARPADVGIALDATPGRRVDPQGLAGERTSTPRQDARGGVAGGDTKTALVVEAEPAARVTPAGDAVDPPDEGVVDACRRRRGGIELPRDDLHVACRALTGVEAAIAVVVGIDDEPHQPALARGVEIGHVGRQRNGRPVGSAQGDDAVVPLGDQRRAVGEEADVPRGRDAGRPDGDLERGVDVGLGRTGAVRREQGGGDRQDAAGRDQLPECGGTGEHRYLTGWGSRGARS